MVVSMRFIIVVAVLSFVSVLSGQSAKKSGSVTLSGSDGAVASTLQWIGSPCVVQDGRKGHVEYHTTVSDHIFNTVPMCIPDDGSPPKYVVDYDPPLTGEQTALFGRYGSMGCDLPAPPHSICIGGQPHKIVYLWKCEKGYEPDGLKVKWTGGLFTPEPDRCKAIQ